MVIDRSAVVSISFDEPDVLDDELDDVIAALRTSIVPFDAELAMIARQTHRRVGRKFHAPGLNFGDCFSYALAKQTGEPLLFTGNDFAKIDIASALA